MGKKQTFRTKAAYFVSDLTTVLLNPISDNNNNNNNNHNNNNRNKPPKPSPPPPSEEEEEEAGKSKGFDDLINGPDTSSFPAFLYSLLSSSDSGHAAEPDAQNVESASCDDSAVKENLMGKKSLFSWGKHSFGKAVHQAARMGGLRIQDHDGLEANLDEGRGVEMKQISPVEVPVPVPVLDHLPEISEPSRLISDALRNAVYGSLPALIHGQKWLMLYSTWKHGISLSTLYRRSMLWPGLSLLVVGDRKGAVFGGLVEAPLIPSNKRKYQGTNSSFVFTNTSGCPVVYRPTGKNRYFTLCSTDFLAIGGGDHFALYLEGDLLSGSSSDSETYGNPCLAYSLDFEVKEVELWGFVYPSKYEEIVALSKTEAPGICRW